VATVLDNSYPLFIILRQRGIISVYIKNVIASESSPLTKAPITPKEVTLRFSNGLFLLEVFKKGYKNKGICAKKNNYFKKKLKFLISRK
jgi:hypothetical protein